MDHPVFLYVLFAILVAAIEDFYSWSLSSNLIRPTNGFSV